MKGKTTDNVKDQFHTSPESVNSDNQVNMLNHSNTFALFDRAGNIIPEGKMVQGIYHEGTRFINKLILTIDGQKPLLLSSKVKEDNDILSVDLTNPVLAKCGMESNAVHILRNQFIRESGYYEDIICNNYGGGQSSFGINIAFDADFKDIFEIRGTKRLKKPNPVQYKSAKYSCTMTYPGLDGLERSAVIKFHSEIPCTFKDNEVLFMVNIAPGSSVSIEYFIHFKTGKKAERPMSYNAAKKSIAYENRKAHEIFAEVQTSNEQFNHWIKRSGGDLFSLLANTETGKYPYGGVPWYNTPFGRDGLITAIETLWLAPTIAKDVLLFLAATQATKSVPAQDADPGKILHEARKSEMANTGEVPFKRYYGSIDATPLFIMLAGMYFERTADIDLIKKIWSNIKAAINWIEKYGDIDGDGFVEYKNKAKNGLTNQGWKDSFDSIMYADGKLAKAPIALCEVQGYVFSAWQLASKMAEALEENRLSDKLKKAAAALKTAFNKQFWNEEKHSFVLALDGEKRPCNVLASNAGQCLFTCIADDDRAAQLADVLMQDDMFSGWGIRTLSEHEVSYNPMSYHNGSVWPHDNALIAYGLSLYGFRKPVAKIMQAVFDASLSMDLQRMPELYCGFLRRPAEGPTAYPVACSPQAWAVGSVFLLLQACLNIKINALKKTIVFDSPRLPSYLNQISIINLKLPNGSCDILINRLENDVGFNLLKKPDDWEVIIKK